MKRFLLLLLALLPSCAYIPRPTSTPVRKQLSGNGSGDEMVVFLPGRWSLAEEFEREGILEIARKKWPDARLVAPDLHIGYYKNQTMTRRLHEDVIQPARQSGVKTIRLVGVSMGGMGALVYDLEHPGEIAEIHLLSPYLGEEEALAEISAADGLAKWNPGTPRAEDFSRRLWVDLRTKWLEKGDHPTVHLGCGTEDRLASSNRMFAKEFLNESDQTWIAGGHDWPTWRSLFEGMAGKP
jgi:pimeloyl-ACP methyl ester carboxylesterase